MEISYLTFAWKVALVSIIFKAGHLYVYYVLYTHTEIWITFQRDL